MVMISDNGYSGWASGFEGGSKKNPDENIKYDEYLSYQNNPAWVKYRDKCLSLWNEGYIRLHPTEVGMANHLCPNTYAIILLGIAEKLGMDLGPYPFRKIPTELEYSGVKIHTKIHDGRFFKSWSSYITFTKGDQTIELDKEELWKTAGSECKIVQVSRHDIDPEKYLCNEVFYKPDDVAAYIDRIGAQLDDMAANPKPKPRKPTLREQLLGIDPNAVTEETQPESKVEEKVEKEEVSRLPKKVRENLSAIESWNERQGEAPINNPFAALAGLKKGK